MPHKSRQSKGELPSNRSLRWQDPRNSVDSPLYSAAPSMPESRQHRLSIFDEHYLREPELDESYGTSSHWIEAMKQQQAQQAQHHTLALHKRARLSAKVKQLVVGDSRGFSAKSKPVPSRLQDSDGPTQSIDQHDTDRSNTSSRPSTRRPATSTSATRPSTTRSISSMRPYSAQSEEKVETYDDEMIQSLSNQSTFLTGTDDTEQMTDDPCDSQPSHPDVEDVVIPSAVALIPSAVALINTYELFVHSRVRHMLIKNFVFIEKDGDAFVSTKRDRDANSQSSCSPFHLPSLQSDTQSNYKSSSASVELASPDEQQLYSLILFLSRIPLFHALPLSAFVLLAQHLHLQTFDEYEVICAEGEPGDFLYFIHKGRVDVKLNISSAATESSLPSSDHPAPDQPRDLYAMAQSAQFVVTQAPAQKRRFHSINSASLDIACLGPHDIAGDSALITGRNASSVIAVTAGCECYAIHAHNLFCVLRSYPTLQSLLSYITYSSLLRQRHAVVRDRYQSSYTSAVKFSLFVDGSLRRNLSHRNQRRKLVREAIGGGANHSNVTSLIDQHAHSQIRHTQKFERRAKRAKSQAEKRRYGIITAVDSSEDDAELIELTTVPLADRIRRSSIIVTSPEFQSPLLLGEDDNTVFNDKLPRISVAK